MMEEVSSDVLSFIDRSCSTLGVTPDQLLRFAFGIGGLSQDFEAASGLLNSASQHTRNLMECLDEGLRLRNPTLTYGVRAGYVNYRRPIRAGAASPSAPGPVSSRSDTFLTLRPLTSELAILLPLEPSQYIDNPRVRDLSGVGHQGNGDLEYRVETTEEIAKFFEEFEDWLQLEFSHP